ncbi:hypothetical protein BC827DRAFT_1273959 [Russula dissimulans]|nr:hypothetical protein BC827DRAFT_1273959 [Russula dissimulans]
MPITPQITINQLLIFAIINMSHSNSSTPYMPHTPTLPIDIPQLTCPDTPPPPLLSTILQEGTAGLFDYGVLEATEHATMVTCLAQIYRVQPGTIQSLMHPRNKSPDNTLIQPSTNPSPKPLPIPPRDKSLPPYSCRPSPPCLLDAISELIYPNATSNPTAATATVLAQPPTPHPTN